MVTQTALESVATNTTNEHEHEEEISEGVE